MALTISYTFGNQSGGVQATELDANFSQLLGYFSTLPNALTINPLTGSNSPLTLIPPNTGVAALVANGQIDLSDAFSAQVNVASGNTGSITNSTTLTVYAPIGGGGVYLVSVTAAAGVGSSAAVSVVAVGTAGVLSASSLVTNSGVSISVSGGNIQLTNSTGSTQAAGFQYNIQRLV